MLCVGCCLLFVVVRLSILIACCCYDDFLFVACCLWVCSCVGDRVFFWWRFACCVLCVVPYSAHEVYCLLCCVLCVA